MSNIPFLVSNMFGVIFLLTIIATPLYFAKNISQIAGIKTESKIVTVSQIDKFPQMSLIQTGNEFKITLNKFAQTQAYLGVIILYNPTNQPQNYQLTGLAGKAFFGTDTENVRNEISLPRGTTVPISIIASNQDNSVQFNIY